jgi:hypothetical protein
MTGTPTSRSRIHPRGPTATLGIALLVLAGACELPTSVPRIEQRWLVPAQSTRIAVSNLLPAGVGILPDSSAFTVNVSAVTVTRSLAQDCAACVAANGTTTPKPAFTAMASAGSSLPAGIVSATLTGGVLQLVATNNYNFDPLRPSATARGYAVAVVTNDGVQIGKDSVNGADVAFPPGGTLTRNISVSGAVTSNAPAVVQITLFSPDGDPVAMDASRTIVVTVTPSGLTVASASVSVSNKAVSSVTTMDLSGIDESITKRVDAGALQLDVDNPFNVAGTLTLQFSPSGGQPLSRSVALVSGISHPVISFTQAELQQLLGHTVTLTLSGPVSSTGGAVAVSPKQTVVVTTRLDISLHTGG